jgi:hypothetical protein
VPTMPKHHKEMATIRRLKAASVVAICMTAFGLSLPATANASVSVVPGMRDLPDPLYGVTVDDVANASDILDSSQHLSHMPTTRIVFDQGVGPSHYQPTIDALLPSSYVMGELLDSSSVKSVSAAAYHTRTANYLAKLGSKVDLWEVGNEVNGEWLGVTSDVVTKISDAYDQVKAAGKRTELTLYYNPNCWSNAGHEMFTWARNNIPERMKSGLDYVLLSYYEGDCRGFRPTQTQWQSVFDQVKSIFPNSRVGFGEVGMSNPATSTTRARAANIMNYYYGLSITTPGFVAGDFWWYYDEDCLPWAAKPLWQTLNSAFVNMPVPTG